ncbi:uncharacterized protein K02A2.6-like [Mizuhopecten yessoensis]|uniref:uncharacterized protein K02A2.6-like n=1 Tax=Mizuhopecten yessoensis TaxID=6573 RepID=UPI000B45C5B6|nr:uncharacterized protein K02A2.6-like [Mizuhopecten yessoensis]
MSVLRNIPVSDGKLEEIRTETLKDETLQEVVRIVEEGWPDHRSETPSRTHDFWTNKTELTHVHGILFKGDRIVIPRTLQAEMLQKMHTGHMGIEKSKKRARELLYWPVCDYYSRYFEVGKLENIRSATVINQLKSFFARHGIPEEVRSDNGPQYSSKEFRKFAEDWGFNHKTSSPHYPQSNGLAEKTVQTVKRMLEKALKDGRDPYLSFLEYRNTPTDTQSPTKLLMSRELRSVIPSTEKNLRPKTVSSYKTRKQRETTRSKQSRHYEKSAKQLPRLSSGEQIRFRHQDAWRPGNVVEHHGHTPRSNMFRTPDGRCYRRNRRHIIRSSERKQPVNTDVVPDDIVPETVSRVKDNTDVATPKPIIGHTDKSAQADVSTPVSDQPTQSSPKATVTRSGRRGNQPSRYQEYEM